MSPLEMPLREQSSANCCLPDVVPHGLILQIGLPIDLHGAGDMALLIEQDIFVRLDDANARILRCSSTQWVETKVSGWA